MLGDIVEEIAETLRTVASNKPRTFRARMLPKRYAAQAYSFGPLNLSPLAQEEHWDLPKTGAADPLVRSRKSRTALTRELKINEIQTVSNVSMCSPSLEEAQPQ